MSLHAETANEILNNMLQAWPIKSLRAMTVQQYANLDDHNAYCY